jgi:hypothetical protein
MARSLTANFEGKFANLRGEICQFSPRDLPSNHRGEIKNHEKFLQNSRPDLYAFSKPKVRFSGRHRPAMAFGGRKIRLQSEYFVNHGQKFRQFK